MQSKQPQEKAVKNRKKLKKIKMGKISPHSKHPEVIYLQSILNSNSFNHVFIYF